MADFMSSTEVLGRRLLKEIADEEESLEDLLRSLRQTSIPNPTRTGIATLDNFWAQHGGKLSITGRGLPFLYRLLSSILLNAQGTIALVDLTAQFSPSHIEAPFSELQHIHVFRPTLSNLKVTLDGVENYMLHGDHHSKGREWFGTIVLGGVGGDVNIGWRGWMKVEREEVGKFGEGVGVGEVWGEKGRRERQEVVNKALWGAECEFGRYRWR